MSVTPTLASAAPCGDELVPPVARREPQAHPIDGRVEDYNWLQDRAEVKDPKIIAHLNAENAYADALLKPTVGFQETLYQEMVARLEQTSESYPYPKGGYLYYTRMVEGKQYAIYCRKKAAEGSVEEVILDLNEVSQGHEFTAIGDLQVSPDGKRLAYSIDFTGFRQYKLFIKDLETGAPIESGFERVTSVEWGSDSERIVYSTEDQETKRSDRVWVHEIGSPIASDALLFEEKDELFGVQVSKSESGKYVFIHSSGHGISEVSFVESARIGSESPRLIAPRAPDFKYEVTHREENGRDLFYINANDQGRGGRIAVTPVQTPGKEHWKSFIDHAQGVTIDGMQMFKHYLVLWMRVNGLLQMKVVDFKDRKRDHWIQAQDAVYSMGFGVNEDYDSESLLYSYHTLTQPRRLFKYGMGSRKQEMVKAEKLMVPYDPSLYDSQRVFVTANDGTRIPVSLVYSKTAMEKEGPKPLYLYAYGSYGIPMDPYFSSARLSLLERGAVFAIAHIRGGGDMGAEWHDDGKLSKKMNTFTDFINVAEHFVRSGMTAPDRLVIEGGSAGGMLMGGVLNMRPDLFKAAHAAVPFMDVLSTMFDETLPLTVGEFVEWGNPKVTQDYLAMKAYSPMDNIQAQNYPTILVTTSISDSQVMYWEPAKYVAKLRAHKTDRNPILLKTDMSSGHGGASGRYDRYRQVAMEYAFILSQLGIDGVPKLATQE